MGLHSNYCKVVWASLHEKILPFFVFFFSIQTKERYKQGSGGVTELTKTLAQVILITMFECSLVHCLEGFSKTQM